MTKEEASLWAKLFTDYANGIEIKCSNSLFYEDIDFSQVKVCVENPWSNCQYAQFVKLTPNSCKEVNE